jgi:DNA-directed RNA polymerase subunit RPC12/RpoP
MSKILILTASPKRDKYIDELIATELRKRGNEVWIRPCLREGRQATLELEPDVVVVPPIRNPYSRDFVAQLKKWGCGVITRHTEPSCSWQDWKVMDEKQRAQIMGQFSYVVDAELVWSQDEAQILAKRGCPFPIVPIGSVSADVYKNEEYRKQFTNKKAFNARHKFDPKKKNLLIASPWGFADSAPDLSIDDNLVAKKDVEGRDRHFKMIRAVYGALGHKWNILITTHPGVMEGPYKELCEELEIPLDTESTMIEILANSDALVHAGSIASMSAHFLDIPAYQYGDVNAKDSDNWWGIPEASISRVSPYCKKPKDLITALRKHRKGSNANKKTLAEMETGRYGNLDGKATLRAADVISKVRGKFKMCWPESPNNYNQPGVFRTMDDFAVQTGCGVCKHPFIMFKEVPNEKDRQLFCPWCGSRAMMK